MTGHRLAATPVNPPKRRGYPARPASERLMARVVQDSNGCLRWTGYPSRGGRGFIGEGGRGARSIPIERVAWEAKRGPIPIGHDVVQTCGGQVCVAVDHLRLVSQSELLIHRLLDRVVAGPGGCWLWIGSVSSGGYGSVQHEGRVQQTHRVAYRLMVGEIPTRKQLDHLCHTRARTCPGGPTCLHRRCLRPDHLEPVSRRENIARGMGPAAAALRTNRCRSGHEFTPENTYTRPHGSRECRTCARARGRIADAKRRHR